MSALPLIRLSDVQRKPIEWLWRGRIPLGAYTMLDGDPDQGKSLIAIDVGARVSRGLPMPYEEDRRAPANVIVVALEDDAGAVIRPRFDAADADVERIHVIGGERDFTLTSEGIRELETAIRDMGVRFVVIDPLMNHLPAEIDANNDQAVRRALRPLNAMAQRCGVAVLIIRHLRKSGGPPKTRGAGSMGIIGGARSGLLVDGAEGRRLLKCPKHNLVAGTVARDVAYRIVARGDVGRVEWLTMPIVPDEAMEPGTGAAQPAESQQSTGIDVRVCALILARDEGAVSAAALAAKLDTSESNARRDYGGVLQGLAAEGLLVNAGNRGRSITEAGLAYLAGR